MKATTQWTQLFCQWVEKRDSPQNIDVLATDTLDSILRHFLAEIKKKDGSNVNFN